MASRETLGEKVRRLMREHGNLTVDVVAKQAGISPSSVSKLLSGFWTMANGGRTPVGENCVTAQKLRRWIADGARVRV
jgi:hypothetical protein